jgi:hypothetical protein
MNVQLLWRQFLLELDFLEYAEVAAASGGGARLQINELKVSSRWKERTHPDHDLPDVDLRSTC